MFTRLGHLVVRRRRTVLTTTLLGVLVAIVLGSGVFAELTNGGFDDPVSESTRAIQALDDEFDTGNADLVAIVTATDGDVDGPETIAAATALTEEFAAIEGTDDVVSYWSLGSPAPLRSVDGDRALILMRFPGAEEDPDRIETIETILDEYEGLERDGLTVGLAGAEPVFAAVGETIEGDLARAEMIAIPLTLLLLLFVFGGVVAAGLPLVVGAISVFGAFMVLWIVTQFTNVSIFSINLVTALGLGLAIDYSLFIVSRFREERGTRTIGRRRGRADRRDRRPNRRLQRHHRGDLAQRTADLPAVLPAVVRLRRDRRARRRHGRVGGRPAGAARRTRNQGRLAAALHAPSGTGRDGVSGTGSRPV